jgi:hypothetical protein
MSAPFLELEILDREPERYARSPIPSGFDDEMSRFVRAFVAQPVDTRNEVVELLTRERYTLRAFAARAASLALTEGSEQRLRDGLLAAVIENFESDDRLSLLTLTALHHTATRIGADFAEIAVEVLAAVPAAENARTFVELFLEQPSTLEEVNFIEIQHREGFRYKAMRF